MCNTCERDEEMKEKLEEVVLKTWVVICVLVSIIRFILLMLLLGVAILLKPFTAVIVKWYNTRLYGKNGLYGDNK